MAVRLVRGAFTVDGYHRLAELGVLCEDDHVELLDGQVVPMTPVGSRHAGCVKYLNGIFSRLGPDVTIVGAQDPVVIGPHSEPQPDIALLRPRADSYRSTHPIPRDVLLLIEVADSSAEYDREVKIPLYAQANIVEVWLVDLGADAIEVYRDPAPEGYASVRTVTRGDRVIPLMLPDAPLPVSDILG